MSLPVLLSKYRPAEEKPGDWERAYAATGWALEPLAKAILELAGDGTVSETDLRGGDAVAILAYRAGARARALEILALLPPKARTP